ncbi:MAG: hypothetical protein V5A72_00030 [Candidatus Nanohaloarchaea archaeon]
MKLQRQQAKIFAAFMAISFFLGLTSAVPQVNGVSTDPGIISAGDEATFSVNMRETDYPDKTWDEDMTLKASLEPGNRLAREHSIITDDRDRSIGFLYPEGVWNQNYQVKFNSDAPTGSYEYRVAIQYLENGEPVEIETEEGSSNITYSEYIEVDVDKKGVELTSTVESTEPVNLRPGNNYATTKVRITNSGNKPVENIELNPDAPEMIRPAYSKDERFFIGKLNPGESSSFEMSINLDEDIESGRHVINLDTLYEDTDSNEYSQVLKTPIRVEGRPDLELKSLENSMSAGGSSELRVMIENTGDHTAESVTARALLEREQPFSLETRSDYIGDIESGETAEAVLDIQAGRTATLKEHQIKIQMRATGDSEEGDRSVYTFTEHQPVRLEGRTRSSLIYVGLIGALAVLGGTIYWKKREGGENNE